VLPSPREGFRPRPRRPAAVWVVNPPWRNVTVYRSPTDIQTLTENDELTGGDAVPGFRCRVGDIFPPA
jgi:Uma2 family endonuclease